MFTVYEVEAWLVGLPWVLFGVAVILMLIYRTVGKRWKICWTINNETLQQSLKTSGEVSAWHGQAVKRASKAEARNEELEAGMTRANENRFKAEADARESSAAHQVCARKLEAEKAEVVKWKGLAEIWQGKAAKLHQKRGKNGQFVGKRGAKKKVSRNQNI